MFSRKHIKIITIIIMLLFGSLVLSSCNPYPNTPEEVWGDLERFEGGRIWDTLTKEQQALVNYPEFDEDCVLWVPNGKSYHSIKWCYTIERSKDIRSGTLTEAFQAGKTDPCSKCVGDMTEDRNFIP